MVKNHPAENHLKDNSPSDTTLPDLSAALRLENQLCFPIYSASRLITQAYAPYLDKMGITYPQYLVLMTLWNYEDDLKLGQKLNSTEHNTSAANLKKPSEPGLTVSQIGEKLLLDSGTLTPILQKLDHNNLIVRARSKIDDRRVLNSLTDLGRNLKTSALEMGYQVFCASKLTLEQVESLKVAIKDLVCRVQDHLEFSHH